MNFRDLKRFKLPILLLFLMVSACQIENQIEDSLNIYEGVYSESKLILEEKYRIELDLDDHQISSFFVTPEEEIFVFDNTFGLIYKIDKQGQTISSTGGIGRGPGEFITEYHLNLTYCGADTFFAFDWSQARFQVYDLDLNLLNVVSLNSIPFDLSCVETGKLAVLYSYIPKIDIITAEGSLQEEILPKVVFDTTKESVARHFTYLRKNLYALSYMFKPVLLMISREDRSQKEIILSKLDFNDVSSAVLRVSELENELHLFYYNINRDLPDREYKISHVFSMDDGKYLYSYRVPEQINIYQFISNNSLAAMEDTMKTVTLYDFKIDHNEQY
jgi:hypothetical protein